MMRSPFARLRPSAAPRLLALTASLAVLLALAAAAPARAQSADLITGRVTDDLGQPVPGARVTAMSIESEITRSVLTDHNGRYMINFPDGGGRYVLRVSFLGKADVTRTIVREGNEDLLLANLSMSTQAITLDSLRVVARRPPPGRGDAGERSTTLSQDMLNRLPLPDLDPSTVAQLAAGVVTTSVDSLSGATGFSVAGMNELLNQVVLDGMVLGQSGLQVPTEGVRSTKVTTSTFDASRGGFAGGQVAMTSTRGNNRVGGALSYQLNNSALQIGAPSTVDAFTRQVLGGAFGGPLVRDKLFYNFAFGVQRNIDHRFAIAAGDPAAALRAGVAVDSIDRFISALQGFQVPIAPAARYDQLRDQLSFQFRTDWNALERQAQAHTLSLRVNASTNDQDSTRISTLDLAQHGGDTGAHNRAGALTLDSRFGGMATNELAASYNEGWNDASPYIALPEGRVRVTSLFADGTSGTQTLVFGGNRNMPTDAYTRSLQLSEDLSFLVPFGDQLHRLKLGGLLQHNRSVQTNTNNLLGSFTFNSIADFQANQPARYDRTLAAQDTRLGTLVGALYLGDTWRISQPLELTAGVRWDYSRLDARPAYNPAVEQAFGRRTDIEPVASTFSPRVGFNYLISSGGGVRSGRVVSGGVGLFAGQPPTGLFATALHQTGLPGADATLSCVGPATPLPDWAEYLADPSSIPTECADGSTGGRLVSVGPTVTLIDPKQKLPSSLRGQIGYQTPLPFNLTGSVQYSYSRGLGLWGFYDLNLDEAERFDLGGESRPFFGNPGDIVPATGQATFAGSRLVSTFGHVWDIRADRASLAHQLVAQVSGMLPHGITVVTNYTYGTARDQGSNSTGGFGGFGGFAPTAGDPNTIQWAPAANDRRHTLNLTLAKALTPEIEITALARVQSGAPFTPMVGGDINGDGLLDDRAFVFDPAATGDTAVANGMRRLVASVPGSIRDCLDAQLGRTAGRNSCRGPWSGSLNLRASLRPNLPRLERRLTVSIDATNVLQGLDQLVHGANNLQGWGEQLRPDTRLLDVRAFDPSTNAFRYVVNEDFGKTIRGPSAIRSPFTLRINARIAIGGIPFLSNRGFGNMPTLAGDMGGGGRGGRGGFGGDFGGGGFGGPGGAGGFGAFGMFRRDSAALNPDSIAARMVSNPLPALLALKDSVGLSDAQVVGIKAVSDSLDLRLTVRRDSLKAAVARIDLSPLRRQADRPRTPNMLNQDFSDGPMMRGGPSTEVRQTMDKLQKATAPALDSARADVARALAAARARLTPAQWQKLPFALRVPAVGAGGARGFNAVGLIDRMLANPLPVLLELKDTLLLTPDQVTRIQAISDKLGERLTKQREALGKRFDNTSSADQAKLFADIQPTIQATRQQVMDALQDVRKVLTQDQWLKLPPEITNPFARRQARQGN